MNYLSTFEGQLRMSEGIDDKKDIKSILLARFPNAISVERASTAEDKNGTDYWVTMRSGEKESVDVKVRKSDWSKKHAGSDDVALEVWSVINKRVGWTRDRDKRTNYIMWIWLDTGRWMLVPFPWLCDVFEKNWENWSQTYKAPVQNTVNARGALLWQSQCVFVPRKILWVAIYATFGGIPA